MLTDLGDFAAFVAVLCMITAAILMGYRDIHRPIQRDTQ